MGNYGFVSPTRHRTITTPTTKMTIIEPNTDVTTGVDEWTQKLNKVITDHNKEWKTHESFTLNVSGSKSTIHCGVCGNMSLNLSASGVRYLRFVLGCG